MHLKLKLMHLSKDLYIYIITNQFPITDHIRQRGIASNSTYSAFVFEYFSKFYNHIYFLQGMYGNNNNYCILLQIRGIWRMFCFTVVATTHILVVNTSKQGENMIANAPIYNYIHAYEFTSICSCAYIYISLLAYKLHNYMLHVVRGFKIN